MKKDEVPQDRARAFQGRSKALYAKDEDGQYKIVPSNGWEAEEIVLDQAIAEYVIAAEDALARARAGLTSPLEYHMFRCRMDVLLLAQSSGFFRWQVRRHLRASIFEALPLAKKQRYADALGMNIEQIESLPKGP